jgi:hypothetical protein
MSPALDLLRELDLLRGGQQRCRPVSRRKSWSASVVDSSGRSRGWGRRFASRAPPSSTTSIPRSSNIRYTASTSIAFEPVRLEHLEQVDRAHGTGDLGGLEELHDLL